MNDILNGSTPQQIVLQGDGIPQSLVGYEVDIHASVLDDKDASSKVRVSTFTNQNWEMNRFYGNTIASNNEYLAYILDGRTGPVIRIIQLDTKNRTLLKKFTGTIVDISFASAKSNMLGAVDEGGNIFVYDLDAAHGDVAKMGNCLKLHIFRGTIPDGIPHRLMWCPNVMSNDDEDDDTLLLAVSHASKVEIFDLPEIATRYSSGIALDFAKIERGVTFIGEAHSGAVTDLSFSPDGRVLATAGEDGHLKFWEVSQEDTKETTKCLHDYQPHNGKGVSRLMFLDNHLTQDPSPQFWRFLITASDYSSEVKIWCTVKWKCLQTIRFLPSVGSADRPRMLLALDLSASYLLAADSLREVLYIIPVHQDPTLGNSCFSSITEYILTQPILSFVISGHTSVSDDISSEGSDGEDIEFNPHRNVVQLKVHCIQTKSMQELLVTFEPPDLTGIPAATDIPGAITTDIPAITTDVPAITTDVPAITTDVPAITTDMPAITTDIPAAITTDIPAAITTDIPSVDTTTVETSDTNQMLVDEPSSDDIDVPFVQGQSMKPPPDYSDTGIFNLMPLKQGVATPIDHTQFGPGQSSPAVKLLSPDSFAIKAMPLNATPTPQPVSLLRSPSDFSHTSLSHDEIITSSKEEGGARGGAIGTLVTLPIKNMVDNENEQKVIVTPTTPTGPGELTTPFPSALTEKNEDEWPSLDSLSLVSHVFPNPPPAVVVTNEGSKVRDIANELVTSVMATALSVIEQEKDIDEDDKEGVSDESSVDDRVSDPGQYIEQNNEIGIEEEIEIIKSEVEVADTNLLQQIMEEMSEYRKEIELLKTSQQLQLNDLQNQFENNLESSTKQMTNELQELFKEQNQRIEKLIKSLETKRTERINQSLTATLQTNVATRLEKTVKNETKNTLLPSIQKSFASTQDGISRAVNEQLLATSAAVNNQIRDILHAEGFIQSISSSIAATVQHILPAIMESLYKNTVLPSFERSCQQMFVQLDEAFRQGTRDYLMQVHDQQTRNMIEPLVQQVSVSLQNLTSSFSVPTSPLVQLVQGSIHNELSTLEPKLQESLRNSLVAAVKSELENVIDSKLTTNNSVTLQHQQEQVVTLIQEKRYDTAFNIALSTSNLQLVTYLCHHVSPEEVFDTNSQCPLSQPVLLSLIQQVAVDLSEDVELKVRYLEHAILSLDPNDHVTSSHLPHVMQLLSDQLVKTEEKLRKNNEGTAQLFRAMKRVRMLSEHVCRSSTGQKK